MNRIITEREFQGEIWRLSQASKTVDVAVSYCGRDATYFLPEHSRPSKVRILVDMSRRTVEIGLTNPRGVAKLCQIADVRSLEGLHSKVVIFGTNAAIVGSTNFSRGSVEQQRQCSILTTDRKTIGQLTRWFDSLWREADEVQQSDCKRLETSYPNSNRNRGLPQGKKKSKVRLAHWKSPLNDYALEPADFNIQLTKKEIRRAIRLFCTTQCGYRKEEVTCAQQCQADTARFKKLSNRFHALLHRIDNWNRRDVTELFELAMTNGRAAMIYKPTFLRNPLVQIKGTMRYLFLEPSGDELIRFEQAMNGRYRLAGLGKSGLTFLMFLWKPNKYASWNNSLDQGLRALKVTMPRPFGTNFAQGYTDRIAALRAMMEKTGLRSFHEIDHFVDAFAKGHLSL